MTTTVLTTKGQVVIPSQIRKRHHLKVGTRLCVLEKGDQILLQPLTEDYFEKMAGLLPTKGKLTKSLLAERASQKRAEENR